MLSGAMITSGSGGSATMIGARSRPSTRIDCSLTATAVGGLVLLVVLIAFALPAAVVVLAGAVGLTAFVTLTFGSAALRCIAGELGISRGTPCQNPTATATTAIDVSAAAGRSTPPHIDGRGASAIFVRTRATNSGDGVTC